MATTASTGSVTSSSSIDVQSIVSQLMSVEKKPLTALETAQTALKTQVSTFGTLKSQLSALQIASQKLDNLTTWQAASAASGDDTKVKAAASSSAAQGSFGVTVSQLAQSQSAISGQFASSGAAIGGGTLTIQMGSTSGPGTFTADSARAAATITIPAGATLSRVQAAINSADVGVTATLVNDGGQTRLMLRSSSTGASNAFSVAASNAENAGLTGLDALNYSPASGGAMTATQSARNANYAIDGLALTSPTNTINQAIDGITLTLSQVSSTPVNIEVKTDTKAIRTAVDNFVSAYNTLNTNIESLTGYDATTKTAGALQGNYVMVQMQSKLRSLLGATVGTGSLSSLSNAGLTIQRDGSLLVSDTKFEAAATDPKGLRKLFASTTVINSDGTHTQTQGIASQFSKQLTQILGSDGSITTAMNTLAKREADNQKKQDSLNNRLEAIQARLLKQYTALDSQLSQMSSLSAQLTQQLDALANNNN